MRSGHDQNVGDFVRDLEAEGHGSAIQEGRRALSTWFDKKKGLRSLRLAAGLSQEQLTSKEG